MYTNRIVPSVPVDFSGKASTVSVVNIFEGLRNFTVIPTKGEYTRTLHGLSYVVYRGLPRSLHWFSGPIKGPRSGGQVEGVVDL